MKNYINEIKGMVFNVQPFSLYDGDGIRTTVFMKGCNLRCYWCHNPESWSSKPQLMMFKNKCIGCGECLNVCRHSKDGHIAIFTDECDMCSKCVSECYAEAIQKSGYEITVLELKNILAKDIDVFTQSKGGVTFSGGEPLLQLEFLLNALKMCKEQGINTAMESAVSVPWKKLERVLLYVDTLFCDIKIIDEQKHITATSQSNKFILENIMKMSEYGVNLRLRVPVIPDFNDDVDSMKDIAYFVDSLPKRHTVELIPFHGLCVGKYEALNKQYKAKKLVTPSREHMEELMKPFEKNKISVRI